MNGCQSPTESYSEGQYNLQRVSDFHAVLLGMAAHDLRQPLQVIQSTYEWLSAASRLYEQTTSMKLSPVPLAPIFDGVRTENVEHARQKGLELRVRPTRAIVVSNGLADRAARRVWKPHARRVAAASSRRHPARLHCAKSSAQCDQIYRCWTRPAFLPSAWRPVTSLSNFSTESSHVNGWEARPGKS
jgi:hypothetical protein